MWYTAFVRGCEVFRFGSALHLDLSQGMGTRSAGIYIKEGTAAEVGRRLIQNQTALYHPHPVAIWRISVYQGKQSVCPSGSVMWPLPDRTVWLFSADLWMVFGMILTHNDRFS